MQNNNKLLCWQYTISMDITSSQRWSTLNGASFDWMLLHRSNCTPHRNINSISSSQPSIFSFAIINRSSSQSPAQQSNIIHIHTELMAFALCDIAIQQASISSQPMELFRHLGRRMKSNSISCLYMVWYIAIKLALGQTVQSYKWKRLQIDTKTHTQIHTQYKRALDVTPPQYHWFGSTSSTRHFCKSCTFHSFFFLLCASTNNEPQPEDEDDAHNIYVYCEDWIRSWIELKSRAPFTLFRWSILRSNAFFARSTEPLLGDAHTRPNAEWIADIDK